MKDRALLLSVGWEEVCLEGPATVPGKTDFGGDPAANEHDMGQQTTERQLRAELLLEVPEVAACWQRLVHVLTEHILCHNSRFNISVCLQITNDNFCHLAKGLQCTNKGDVPRVHALQRRCLWQCWPWPV